MAKYVIDEKTLTDIAVAIRDKKGTEGAILTENFASEINGIEVEKWLTQVMGIIDKSITEISIPEETTTVGRYVFFQCGKLKKVTLHDKITNIDNYAFGNCVLTGEITLPDSLERIGENAFRYNTPITKIVFGKGITSLESAAFDNCVRCLEYDFTRCEKVPTLGANVFRGIKSGAVIKVPAELHREWIMSGNWSPIRKYVSGRVTLPIDPSTGETRVYLDSVWVFNDMPMTGTFGVDLKAYYKAAGGERIEITNESPAFNVWGFESATDEGGWSECRFTNVGGDFTYFNPGCWEFWIENSLGEKIYSRILEVTE